MLAHEPIAWEQLLDIRLHIHGILLGRCELARVERLATAREPRGPQQRHDCRLLIAG
jgi:hypothetical protein